MSEPYTPTTEEVRDWYGHRNRATHQPVGEFYKIMLTGAVAEFDRWLAAHDREVAANALRDAAEDGEIQDNRPWVHWWLTARADQIENGEVA